MSAIFDTVYYPNFRGLRAIYLLFIEHTLLSLSQNIGCEVISAPDKKGLRNNLGIILHITLTFKTDVVTHH